MQRALVERDQQSVEFAARPQGAPPAEQQRPEHVCACHLLEVQRDQPPELWPHERRKAARDTEAFVLRLPPPVVRIEVPEELRPRVVEPLQQP